MPASAPARQGCRMPTRQRWPGAGVPKTAISPPPFTIAAAIPATRKMVSARSTAQPLTRPVGSTPEGLAHGSNQPPDSLRASSHKTSTSVTSAGRSLSSTSPLRRRLTGLCGSHVLKVASAQCNAAHAASIAGMAAPPDWPPGTTANDTTVPMTGSAWLTICTPGGIPGLSFRLLDMQLVQRRLDGHGVRLAGVGGPAHAADAGGLAGQHL